MFEYGARNQTVQTVEKTPNFEYITVKQTLGRSKHELVTHHRFMRWGKCQFQTIFEWD